MVGVLTECTTKARTSVTLIPQLITCTKVKCPNKCRKFVDSLKLNGHEVHIYFPEECCDRCLNREDIWELNLEWAQRWRLKL